MDKAEFTGHIYIPVWIDLKMCGFRFISPSTIIYIPVWIDLKLRTLHHRYLSVVHLHSSMDRFEVHIADSGITALF